ncbi:DUF3793 family protein [Clostridium rectalis]|uniref:DUF3793 family protein n=1 Tax=Clostridium rectalis TaxID=2040295 RepID=UPI0013DD952E|nr:DUF3793 family protein [Clostridium rectalis]
MSKVEIITTLQMIKDLEDKEYMFSMISYNIAPTIYKDKPSSIISFSKNNKNLYDLWQKYGEEFLQYFNIKAFHIKDTGDTHTVLFYKEDKLQTNLFKKEHINFLNEFGYKNYMSIEEHLLLLKSRYEISCPHEIGIFLGIPLSDVICFMESSKKPCLMCGYWKVYHNLKEAVKTFKNYDEAKIKALKTIKEEVDIHAWDKG